MRFDTAPYTFFFFFFKETFNEIIMFYYYFCSLFLLRIIIKKIKLTKPFSQLFFLSLKKITKCKQLDIKEPD